MRNPTLALWTLLTLACPGNGDGPTTGTTGTSTDTTAGSGPGTTTTGATGTSASGSTSSSSSGSGDPTATTSTGTTDGTTGPVDSSGSSGSSGSSDTSGSSGEPSTTGTTGGETPFEGDAADGEVCGLIIQACVYQCYQLKWPCIDACIAEGSPNGAAEAQAVVDCAYIDCNYDTNCYTSFCLDEWYACTQGPLTCEQEVACIQHCAGDSECRARCYYESTAAAQKQYDDLEFCRMSQSCAELDDQCMKEFCTWNYMACLGWP